MKLTQGCTSRARGEESFLFCNSWRESVVVTDYYQNDVLPGSVTLLLVKATITVGLARSCRTELRPGIYDTPLRDGEGAGVVHSDGEGVGGAAL